MAGGDVFKIGEFSKFCFVTVKTLRYYDRIGLLPPAYVDETTGYRYYSAEQVPCLNRILALKDLGLTLEQIGNLVDGDLPADHIRGMLRLRQVELRQQMDDDQSRLAQVEWRLQQMEHAGTSLDHDVVIKAVAEQAVASVREEADVARIIALVSAVYAFLERHDVSPTGPLTGVYYDDEFPLGPFDAQIAVPIGTAIPANDLIVNSQLPSVEKMACVIHQGCFESLGCAYQQLLSWVDANRYRVSGPVREVHVQGPPFCTESARFVTEIQVPVEKMPPE